MSNGHGFPEVDNHNVRLTVGETNVPELICVLDDTFGKQEACRQFKVIPWRSHRN